MGTAVEAALCVCGLHTNMSVGCLWFHNTTPEEAKLLFQLEALQLPLYDSVLCVWAIGSDGKLNYAKTDLVSILEHVYEL